MLNKWFQGNDNVDPFTNVLLSVMFQQKSSFQIIEIVELNCFTAQQWADRMVACPWKRLINFLGRQNTKFGFCVWCGCLSSFFWRIFKQLSLHQMQSREQCFEEFEKRKEVNQGQFFRKRLLWLSGEISRTFF